MKRKTFFYIACLAALAFAARPGAGEAPAEPARAAEAQAPDATAETLRRILQSRELTPAETAALQDALGRLRNNAGQALSVEDSRLAAQLRDSLEKRHAANPGNRALARTLARYLLFLDDAPAALAVMKEIRPAASADIAWPLGMADICLQLGDAVKARMYAAQAENLLRKSAAFVLNPPMAVTDVQGYRIFTPDARTEFAPGSRLLLYVEIEGARFHVSGREWQCKLDFGLELLNADGGVCDKKPDFGRYDPVFNGNVREIHASLNYQVPADLAAGKYTLRFYCKDAVADASAQTDFTFTVGGAAERKEPQKERKVDAEAYSKILEGKLDDPLAPELDIDGGIDTLTDELKKKYKIQGLGISRERSKMQGGLFNQQ